MFMLVNFVGYLLTDSCLSNFTARKTLQSLWKRLVNIPGNNSPPPPSLHPSVLILVIGITLVSKAFNNFIIFFSQHFNSHGKKKNRKKKVLNCFCTPLRWDVTLWRTWKDSWQLGKVVVVTGGVVSECFWCSKLLLLVLLWYLKDTYCTPQIFAL